MSQITATELSQRWADLKKEQPHIRIRNAAEALGVSEVELLATNCGDGVTRLKSEFREILGEIEKLGKVMALTRNDEVVHERKGIYLNPTLTMSPVGLFVGEDIDLRIFFASWDSAFAVQEPFPQKPGEFRYSLQFFAKDGSAIHKIYLTPESNQGAYIDLVTKFISEDQSPEQIVVANAPARPEMPDDQIDVANFKEEWKNLKDTHDFFGMLKKYQVGRTQALRLAPEGDYAVKVANTALRDLVTKASEKEVPIMVFVGNPGMIQIHTGPVKRLLDHEGWFNVIDPDFNLHVSEPKIAESWIVRKPTTDGMVTALECFNDKGDQIVQLFGKRKPGLPELTEWREIVSLTQEAQKVTV